MQFNKIDAALASALEEPASNDPTYHISVRVARALTLAEQQEFQQLGGVNIDPRMPVLAAQATRASVEELSNKPWVRSLALVQQRRPLA